MSTEPDSELVERARAWAEDDPDPETRAELLELVERGALTELAERMAPELDFGTAGLRGAVGAGPARMNRAVVVRAARALAEHWSEHGRGAGVVVGRDARLSSAALAEAAAGVVLGAGHSVYWFEDPVPTPLVAFAARVLGATGAIAITASHNPREDNGLKAYGPDAMQLVAPADMDVARRREALPGAAKIPCVSLAAARANGAGLFVIGRELEERYLAELEARLPEASNERALRIAYTPLHGVGRALLLRALARRGFSDVHVVPEQAEPDGRFPTTPKPNPEEPGTLERVLELGTRVGADLAVANDPDADRLAAAVADETGELRGLSGNELGVLLADFVLERAPKRPQPLLVTSIVSTPLLEQVALERGARFERTLTGFKWIWLAAQALEASEAVRFAFGCEEALGYSTGSLVRDKDGISAAVFLCELAARCRAEGTTLLGRLEALFRRHGAWASAQRSLVRPGASGISEIRDMVDRLAAAPPEVVAGTRLSAFCDYRNGADRRPVWLGRAALLELTLGPGLRVLVRPSGTEPKLKIYADAREPVQAGESGLDAAARAKEHAETAADAVARLLRGTEPG